jgi:hypothetical protein
MRRTLIAFALTALLLVTTGCPIPDFGNPESIRALGDDAFRSYFPNVHTIVDSQRGVIVAITCATGLGPGVTSKISDLLPSFPEFSKLKTLRTWGPLLGQHTYGIVALGFENSMVSYNLDTGYVGTVNEPDEAYATKYARTCGISGNMSAPPVSNRAQEYAIIGVWRVSATVDGRPRTSTWYDTLGSYRSFDAFTANRDQEVATREALILAALRNRNWQDATLWLMQVNSVPINVQAMAH